MFDRSARRRPPAKKRKLQEKGEKTEVHFFDFDHTIFHSPGPPPDIPKGERGKFWHDPESLSHPLVPSDPNQNWYIQHVIEEYRKAKKNPRAKVVVITGRSEPFREKIRKLLEGVGEPDELILKQKKEQTRPYKIREMKRVMGETPRAKKIHFYEDRESHLRDFQREAEKEGFRFHPHFIQERSTERTWDDFMQVLFEGGAKQVRNTNSETKDQYPTVRADHLIKTDPQFAERVRRRFRQWVSAGKPKGRQQSEITERRAEGDDESVLFSLELNVEHRLATDVARRWLLASAS